MVLERKLLKVSGILYAIMGVLLLEIPVYGALLILSGIYFFVQSFESEEIIYKQRVLNYILAALCIYDFISSIIIFIVQENVAKYFRRSNSPNAPPKVIYKLDKESKKIDILLKLGVAMVFISGVLFATTTWSFISNYIKAIALIVFGLLFLFLALFTENKLKLYRSSYMYWILSMSLFILTIVGALYLGLFGTYLTYSGGGKYLAYAITFLTSAGFAFTTYLKFPKKYLLYLCYGFLFMSLAYILSYFNVSSMMCVAIISCIVMLINIVCKKTRSISMFSNAMSYLLFAFILVSTSNSDMELLAACIINIINLNYLACVDKEKDLSFINIILSQILIIYGLSLFKPLGDCIYIMIALTSTIYTLLINGNIIATNKFAKRLNYILFLGIMFVLLIKTIGLTQFIVPSTYVFIPIILLVVNTFTKYGLFRVDKWKLANYLQPFIILCIIDSTVEYLNNPISAIYEMAIISLIYCILHFAYKTKLDKSIMYAYILCLITISFGLSMTYQDIFGSLLIIVSALYLFTASFTSETNEVSSMIRTNLAYITLLSSLYIPFVYNNILSINIFIPALIFIVLTYIIALLLKEKWIKRLSYLYIVLPLSTLITSTDTTYVTKSILSSFTQLYVMYLVVKFFIKDSIAKNIVLIVSIIFCCADTFLIDDIYAGIYIGILGLIIIIAGYKRDDLTPLFTTGIIMTVLNIIYRLKDVWKVIPFWLYLLVGGLAIIFFVTYRELKKQNKSKQ